jgi:hypothetical protein
MSDKELKHNIKEIKQLLTFKDYDKIDNGVEFARSLNDPKIFENLLNGCSIGFAIEGGYEHEGTGGGHRPILNDWLSKLQIQNASILENPTGYYVFLSLILNQPKDANIDGSLKLNNITELSLKNCWIKRLPSNMSRLSELKILDISFNRDLKESKSNLTTLKKLEYIIDHETYLSHGFTPKINLKNNDESCECIGCKEIFESERNMVKRYDGNFCQHCDENWNSLRWRCSCCRQKIDPTINDYKIDIEDKVELNDTLFDEEYDCKEEDHERALYVNDTVIFDAICSYCEQDSRVSDKEFELFIIKVENGEIPKDFIEKILDYVDNEETGITDSQYQKILKFSE